MCNAACIGFGRTHLTRDDVLNKKVIEVGALDVNGSLRAGVEALGPATYLGVDVASGPGVDEICDISDLRSRYGREGFDVVLSTEVLEHVRDWRGAISNLKSILKPGGVLLITTRSKGFPYHGYPNDFWRYEADDIRTILSDLVIDVLQEDPISPGIFVKARRPERFSESDLGAVALYSIVTKRRCLDVTDFDIRLRKAKRWLRLRVLGLLPARSQPAR